MSSEQRTVQEPFPANSRVVFKGIAAAGRAFAVLMGCAGLGLLVGLGHGARVASKAASNDVLLTIFGWIVSLAFSGVTGLVLGLGAGLLIMIFVGIVRLAGRIGRNSEGHLGG